MCERLLTKVQCKDQRYEPFIGKDDKPPIDDNQVARWTSSVSCRSTFYYEPGKYNTYLEQLGVIFLPDTGAAAMSYEPPTLAIFPSPCASTFTPTPRPSPSGHERGNDGGQMGDEQGGSDPTVWELCDRTAALLGKDAAMFMPSGTMCNQVALATHCRPGDEILAHEDAHIQSSEAGGPERSAA